MCGVEEGQNLYQGCSVIKVNLLSAESVDD